MLSNSVLRLSALRTAQQSFQLSKTLPCAAFSSTASSRGYDDTIANLNIGKDTRVIFQGFTGKQATANAQESIAWGTNVVGGVRPGKTGEHLGLPVLPTVRAAMEQLKPDATGIYVAGHLAVGAIEEAIEAEMPLIVVVAEHIPLHDILRVHSILKTQSKSRLVGANAPGIISSIGHCRIGFQPLPCFTEGHVGIIAKSGTLSYETVGGLTRAGVGQSLCISMGGDVVAGTSFVDALKLFENDPDTHAIILIGEVGGRTEEDAADWIKDYHKRVKDPKPIAALIGGIQARPRTIMGHAGAWAAPGESSAAQKVEILRDAGVTMVDHPAKFGKVMKGMLEKKGLPLKLSTPWNQTRSYSTHQRRSMHTSRRLPRRSILSLRQPLQRHRTLHLRASDAAALLAQTGFTATTSPSNSPSESRLLTITVDRSARSPCVIASPTADPSSLYHRARSFPISYVGGPSPADLSAILSHADLDAAPPAAKAQAANLLLKLFDLFKAQEAIALTVRVGVSPAGNGLEVSDPQFSFDDAAFRSAGRHAALHALRDVGAEDAAEVAGEADGIVYVKLGGADDAACNVGTLVNGAGLAMNTVDALAARGGRAANFLDTGGKATSETVRRSFELILADPRVRVVFVNIFGGLTLGDMIARGVILAFKELSVPVPVVVRIRGTNEQEGQRLIAESGLDLWAFDDFDEAAAKVMGLADKSMRGESVKEDEAGADA